MNVEPQINSFVGNGRLFQNIFTTMSGVGKNLGRVRGNEWDSSRVWCGQTRKGSSKYMYYIPRECMYVSRVNGRIISLAL